MMNETPFSKKVMQWIRKVPSGKIATYGQIAQLAGRPGAARTVSWILHSCSETHGLPWHRIINAQGEIAFRRGSREFKLQKIKLQREGVEFVTMTGVDLGKTQWKRGLSVRRSTRRPSLWSR